MQRDATRRRAGKNRRTFAQIQVAGRGARNQPAVMSHSFFILSTGSELTSGRSIDGNGPFLAATLSELGYDIYGTGILPDDPVALKTEIAHLMEKDLAGIVMTGGLGPTADDHTLDVVAELTGRQVIEDPKALRKLEVLATRSRGRLKTEEARRQVRSLEGATVLTNEHGLAPGLLVEYGAAAGDRPAPVLVAMPGVPQEMSAMFTRFALPALRERFPARERARRVFYVYGVGESTFQSRFFGGKRRRENDPPPLAEAGTLSGDFRWGITAGEGRNKVFFDSYDSDEIDRLYDLARGEYADQLTDDIVENLLHEICLERELTIGAAESCTGGLVGKLLTDRPGSSGYFLGSIVCYANSAKEKLLGVPAETLATHGAVSPETAAAMATGARAALGCDFAVSVTGIAGPGGGTPEKPVGLIYMGVAGRDSAPATYVTNLPLDRDRLRRYGANMALFFLLNYIRSDGAYRQA